jgi:hypothetical protein
MTEFHILSIVIVIAVSFTLGLTLRRKPEPKSKGVAFVDSDIVPMEMMETVGRSLGVSAVVPFSGTEVRAANIDISESIQIK